MLCIRVFGFVGFDWEIVVWCLILNELYFVELGLLFVLVCFFFVVYVMNVFLWLFFVCLYCWFGFVIVLFLFVVGFIGVLIVWDYEFDVVLNLDFYIVCSGVVLLVLFEFVVCIEVVDLCV